jgi:hypothetical protein
MLAQTLVTSTSVVLWFSSGASVCAILHMLLKHRGCGCAWRRSLPAHAMDDEIDGAILVSSACSSPSCSSRVVINASLCFSCCEIFRGSAFALARTISLSNFVGLVREGRGRGCLSVGSDAALESQEFRTSSGSMACALRDVLRGPSEPCVEELCCRKCRNVST